MKEQIYTIPVNEVYDTDCECPLCELEKKLEKETLDYTLGAAMMEPEFRMESNEKGFCNHHYSMLFGMSNKLALSLVLDTHLEEIRKKFDTLKKSASALKNQKAVFLRKQARPILQKHFPKNLTVYRTAVLCVIKSITLWKGMPMCFFCICGQMTKSLKKNSINQKVYA